MKSVDEIKQFLDAQFERCGLNLKHKNKFNCSEGIDWQIEESNKAKKTDSTNFPIFYITQLGNSNWRIDKFLVPYAGVV